MKKVRLLSSDNCAVVHSENMFAVLSDGRSVFLNKVLPLFNSEFWYVKIPILNSEDNPVRLEDCLIDWEKMPDDVLSIQHVFQKKKTEGRD